MHVTVTVGGTTPLVGVQDGGLVPVAVPVPVSATCCELLPEKPV
jgi:hypothetical protein